MNRTLILLALAALVCVVMSIVAFILKLTAALGLILLGAVAIIAIAAWLALRLMRRGPYG